MRSVALQEEDACVRALQNSLDFPAKARTRARERAASLVAGARSRARERPLLDSFLQEFALSSTHRPGA